ncbi:hypothetical protein IWQ62_002447 [Dispira parvispora]|uniref:Dihydrolipoamide acetyltransferase component of pyruvate dehydrogenase complex n=1 Tax=Dispira parvispora TaxID=1520584 RepID=A0A9W8ARB4_9FUNG|nr:hypothetical protein IWQ62_002447 [Dispira parvispora]
MVRLSILLRPVSTRVFSAPLNGCVRRGYRCGLSPHSSAPVALPTSHLPAVFSRNNSLQRRAFSGTPSTFKVIPFNLADIGEGITECEIIQWFVKPGDSIAQFDKICEVQSDKASVEITSRYDGTVSKLHYEAGEMANVGKPLVDIEVGGESDSVAESPKTPSDTVAASATPQPAPTQPAEVKPFSLSSSGQEILTIPAVRRLAKENSVDLTKVTGTGKAGRITKEDVLRYMAGKQEQPAVTPQSTASVSVVAPVSQDEEKPLTAMQKAMFKSMTASLAIPHFGFSDEFEMDACMVQRQSLNQWLASQGTESGFAISKVSYMPFFIKALSIALKKYPILNAALLNGDGGISQVKLLYRASHNIGVAMDTPQGLVVPNIKNVQNKSLLEIAEELQRLMVAGKANALTPADLQNGTVTLSNVGMIGGINLNPVLVTSQLCIGAIGKMRRLPRFEMVRDPQTGVESERVVPKHLVRVSWSADHRIIDGATMASFAAYWQHLLQNPSLMLAQLK